MRFLIRSGYQILDLRLVIEDSAIDNPQSAIEWGLPERLRKRKGTHRPSLEVGRDRETEVELGVPSGTEVAVYLRIRALE
jgi:hypothetical protein